jgi:hypothetical protein
MSPRAFTLLPYPSIRKSKRILSQASAPVQSITRTSVQIVRIFGPQPQVQSICSFRGLVPYSVCNHEERLISDRSHPAGYVASSEFLTLSTPCSPHGLLGLFHPSPAHGVCPSRFCSLPAVVLPLGSHTLLGLASHTPKHGLPPFQGFYAWQVLNSLDPLFRRAASSYLLGLCSPLRFLASRGGCFFRSNRSPHALFRRTGKLFSSLAPQGIHTVVHVAFLSRDWRPPWSFAPRRFSRFFRTCELWVTPRKCFVSPQNFPFLFVLASSLPELFETPFR